jgi:hypothetical protein
VFAMLLMLSFKPQNSWIIITAVSFLLPVVTAVLLAVEGYTK